MPRKKTSTKKPILFLTAIILAVLIPFSLVIFNLLPVNQGNTTPQIFIVKKGESLSSVSQRLKDENLIRNALAFKLVALQKGFSKKIQAGDFRLNKSMSPSQIAENLTSRSLDIWVTALEGWRREEIAAAIDEEFLAQGAIFDRQGFLELTKDLEGYLFPDTYLIPRDSSPQNIIDIFTTNFEKKADTLQVEVTKSGRSLGEIIIMASIVEREARGSARPIVAGVLWKRLEAGWPLQADATLQYAKGLTGDTWWTPPSSLDKQISSLYNTYQNLGLPPSPIANPSLDSIEATTSPEDSNYWFYLTDLDGQMHYAVTLEQHNLNVSRYLR